MGALAGRRVDLNSDLGESFGAYRIGADDALLGLVSSANVACGFHGGDPRVLAATVAAARERRVAVGAHPGYPDLVGFGRRDLAASPEEVTADVLYQLGALGAFCRAAGVPMRHVKAHGALSNRAVTDPATAGAIVAAVRAYDADLVVLSQPGALIDAAEAAGLPVAREAFADRAYNPDGTLVSRRLPGALVTDPARAADRMARLLAEGSLPTVGGADLTLSVDSICVHADTPGAAEIMAAVRARLTAEGVAIRPPGDA
ncbi:MAG: Lactam utilization protein LamB [uncultured Thermomicrobiales bacterium]|uniref:5-oxoprolinase subunit A n=1 Tax=uncultured Thermomicrobiales bacterium TaxID=1645740 RepID=A0A6J4UP90_9BACT|nr:MAG: Lactam utilization protein LamB [uncultured Thermomicrobiales bacterium]